jgi:hypothetical protein
LSVIFIRKPSEAEVMDDSNTTVRIVLNSTKITRRDQVAPFSTKIIAIKLVLIAYFHEINQ